MLNNMEIPLLTSGESKVYQALVELGGSSIGDILKLSGVSHSKIYDILKRLSKKGLVSTINKNGKQHFSASNPSSLSELAREEKIKVKQIENKMSEVIRQLEVKRNTTSSTSLLSSFEGLKGMKAALESILAKTRKNDQILILGSPKQIGEQVGGYLKEWQKRRIKIGAKCKIVTDIDAPSWKDEWWIKSKKNKLTFTKRSKSVSPAYLIITNSSVTTIYFSSKIFSFVIEHPDIALRYQEFFNELWKTP